MKQTKCVTRRSFLRGASLVFGAPLLLPLRAAPSERLNVGFIGVGKRGHNLLRKTLRFPEAQVVAVSDVVVTRREAAAKTVEDYYSQETKGTFQGCAQYRDFRELLAREDIDAVVIATPDHWHAIPVVEAARAKKDIYCEKPLSLTIREARLMADTVKRYGVVFQTGSQQRTEWDGKFRHACELVRNGRIGKVLTVHVEYAEPSVDCDLPDMPVPADTDWDTWLGQAPYRGYHDVLCPRGVHDHFPLWRTYKDYSGGPMTDFGAHHFDIAQWGLGMDHTGPVEIIPPDGKEYEHLTYKYANGVLMYHAPANSILFTGTDGTVEVGRQHFKTSPESIADEEIGEDEIKLYRAKSHIGNWLECIRTRQDPICTAEIGCRSVTVCHLGNLAYWNKRRLRWDPENYRFVGDEEANTWLDRPRRPPWKLDSSVRGTAATAANG